MATTLEMLQEKLMQTLSRDRDARVSQLGAISSALASNGRIALKIHVCTTAPYTDRKVCNARTQFVQRTKMLTAICHTTSRR